MSSPAPNESGEAVLFVRPEARASDLERAIGLAGRARTVSWSDPGGLCGGERAAGITCTGFWGSVRLAGNPRTRAVVVPEPLWLRQWPRTVLFIVAARLTRAARRVPKAAFGTFAIENLTVEERLTIPWLDRAPKLNARAARVLLALIRVSARVGLDTLAFGTEAARANYGSAGLLPSSTISTVIPEALGPCAICESLGWTTTADRKRALIFVGELAPRKGVDVLLAAWDRSELRDAGWTLTLCGTGELEGTIRSAAREDPSIRMRNVDRAGVHAAFRSAAAVVLPSQHIRRWREQVGLSMLEGEAHGCALIVSNQSGAADELRRRAGATVVDDPSAVDAWVEALDGLPHHDAAVPTPASSDSALVAFMLGGAAEGRPGRFGRRKRITTRSP